MDPSDIFNPDIDPRETKEKVESAISVLNSFKQTYQDHKAKLHSYFTGDQDPVEWEFTPKLVFPRFDKFIGRLNLIVVSSKKIRSLQKNDNVHPKYFLCIFLQ